MVEKDSQGLPSRSALLGLVRGPGLLARASAPLSPRSRAGSGALARVLVEGVRVEGALHAVEVGGALRLSEVPVERCVVVVLGGAVRLSEVPVERRVVVVLGGAARLPVVPAERRVVVVLLGGAARCPR